MCHEGFPYGGLHFPSLVAAQVVAKVENDEMTGKTNAYAAWASDSLDGHFGPFQARLMIRCRDGKLEAILSLEGKYSGRATEPGRRSKCLPT